MMDAVTSLLENFSHKNRDVGRRLEDLLSEDPGAFQQAVVQYLLNGGQQQSSNLVIWLLQRRGKLLDLLLNRSFQRPVCSLAGSSFRSDSLTYRHS